MKKLSDLLEKLELKFPDDKDVLEVVAEFNKMDMPTEGEEDTEAELELELEPSEEMPAEGESKPMDFAALLGEDLGAEGDEMDAELEIEMPPKKKKK